MRDRLFMRRGCTGVLSACADSSSAREQGVLSPSLPDRNKERGNRL